MLRKNKDRINTENKNIINTAEDRTEKAVKYESPQILMIDCPEQVVEKIQKDGFNVETGTFGVKYKVRNNGKDKFVQTNDNIGNIIEKDIIIINMKNDKYSDEVYEDARDVCPSASYWWLDKHEIEFNPRNIASYTYSQSLHKFTSKNSVIIIFADRENNTNYTNKVVKEGYIERSTDFVVSNYQFLPYEINVQTSEPAKKYKDISNGILKNVFKNYKSVITSYCTFYRNPFKKNFYEPILKNIYNETIAYCECQENKKNEETIRNTLFMLPQCEDMYLPISNILNDVLPCLYPDMMADFVKDSWINDEKYIFPRAKELIDEKKKIEFDYKEKLLNIESLLSKEYQKYKFMYDILSSSGTGEKLVESIIECLKYIGYDTVINYDKEKENEDNEEDLHIYYNDKKDTYFIAEVKGINGPAIEDDCNVIVKYKSRNCEKCKKSYIHGVIFFNYHKNVEPEKREKLGFTSKEIKDAIRDGYTLVGTYELFKAIRLYQENIISKESIRKNLETRGLFTAIPNTFENIGKIEDILKQKDVICLTLDNEEVNIKDELLVIDNNNYYKTRILSLMNNNIEISKAEKGMQVGIRVDKIPNKKSATIYLIK